VRVQRGPIDEELDAVQCICEESRMNWRHEYSRGMEISKDLTVYFRPSTALLPFRMVADEVIWDELL